jgi:hypothetical protein
MKKNIIVIIALLSMAVSSQVPKGVHATGSCNAAHCDSGCCSHMPHTNALLPVSANNSSTLPICCIRDHSSSITQVNPIQGFKTCKTIIKYNVIEYKSFKSFDGKRILSGQNAEQSFLFPSNSIPLRI